jgi:hypothetical protein
VVVGCLTQPLLLQALRKQLEDCDTELHDTEAKAASLLSLFRDLRLALVSKIESMVRFILCDVHTARSCSDPRLSGLLLPVPRSPLNPYR